MVNIVFSVYSDLEVCFCSSGFFGCSSEVFVCSFGVMFLALLGKLFFLGGGAFFFFLLFPGIFLRPEEPSPEDSQEASQRGTCLFDLSPLSIPNSKTTNCSSVLETPEGHFVFQVSRHDLHGNLFFCFVFPQKKTFRRFFCGFVSHLWMVKCVF